MLFMGIDPGQSGGLAVLGMLPVNDSREHLVKMPPTERDIWDWISQFTDGASNNAIAVIEKVHAMPGNGVSGMFRFGQGFGALKMALCAAGIPYTEVSPQTWQKALGIPPRKPNNKKKKVAITKGKNKGQWQIKRYGGESTPEFKKRLRSFAQKLFPKVEITLATADALLIAFYCQRKYQGLL